MFYWQSCLSEYECSMNCLLFTQLSSFVTIWVWNRKYFSVFKIFQLTVLSKYFNWPYSRSSTRCERWGRDRRAGSRRAGQTPGGQHTLQHYHQHHHHHCYYQRMGRHKCHLVKTIKPALYHFLNCLTWPRAPFLQRSPITCHLSRSPNPRMVIPGLAPD